MKFVDIYTVQYQYDVKYLVFIVGRQYIYIFGSWRFQMKYFSCQKEQD